MLQQLILALRTGHQYGLRKSHVRFSPLGALVGQTPFDFWLQQLQSQSTGAR
jgi:hypothetical protein